MPPNDTPTTTPPSRLMHALQQREATQTPKTQPRIRATPSRSTSFHLQQQRRRPSTVAPTPTMTSSLSIHRRRTTSGTTLNKPADVKVLPRLEEENANLPPQDSIEFILAQIERQNAILDEDPKSVCIQSNELKVHLSTLQTLVERSPSDNDAIDWEFWSALTEDFSAVALKLPHLISAKLKAGIPPDLRGVIWQAMSQAASLHLETVYGQLLEEHSPYERIIQRDLARTFPHVDMFKQEGGDGQRALERILKAYSLYDAHVGYCQGLAFLVGPLLMNMPEQQAFCVFVRLMETYEMRTMFTLNMEGLQLRLYQFTSLLAQILPELSDHLANHAVHSPMYASQWFLTLFAYAFPISLVFRIYDIVFAEGAAETIMRVAIAMLKRSQEKILQMTEFEDILDCVTSKLHLAYDGDETAVISDAMALSGLITGEKLDHLADLYLREVEEEQKQTEQVMAVRFNFWAKKKKRESGGWLSKRNSSSGDEESGAAASRSSTPSPASSHTQDVQSSNSSTTTPPSQDVAALHEQIEELLLVLSATQKDHLQLQQELVQIKMDKLDVEAERDALKMTMLDMQQEPSRAMTYKTMGDQLRKEVEKLQHANASLQQQVDDLLHQNELAKDAQTVLVEKMLDIKTRSDQLESEKQAMIKERRALQERLSQAEIVTRELQQENEKLLGELANARRQSPSAAQPQVPLSEKEARCEELEQLLADAKLRIAELETFGSTITRRNSNPHRMSMPPPQFMSSTEIQDKRRSMDPKRPNPMHLPKRSSFYGRLWSSVTSAQDTPPTSPL